MYFLSNNGTVFPPDMSIVDSGLFGVCSIRQCLHWRKHHDPHHETTFHVVGDLEIWRRISGGKETETMRTMDLS